MKRIFDEEIWKEFVEHEPVLLLKRVNELFAPKKDGHPCDKCPKVVQKDAD